LGRHRGGGPLWTNGRTERFFGTFKSTIYSVVWLLRSVAQVDRFCTDFVSYYNRDRPHSAFDGRTPDEVYFDRDRPRLLPSRITYFDGQFRWYKFG